MLIKIPRGWELPEQAATPESVFRNRRALLKGLAAGPFLAAAAWQSAGAQAADPSAKYYPTKRNDMYKVDREITNEVSASAWNNFYEYMPAAGNITAQAQQLKTRPWEVKITGMVDKPFTIAFYDLLTKVQLEERVYRHRCVETWSMTVPWSGFPLKQLVDLAKPLGSARYVKMVTFNDKDMAPVQRQFWWPWPYTDGLTIEEATHDLAFIATGIYGKPMPKQHGAPLRLAVPWKYGFKAVKSIVEFNFTDQRPATFWETTTPREYGFWANVNPAVAHPRWSQAEERPLGGTRRVPTLLYNGYADQVASLYNGMPATEKLFM